MAGLALTAAFDPWGWGEVAPVAVAALIWSQTRAGTLRAAFALGAVGGWSFFAVHVWWLQESIGTGAWVGITATQGLWSGLAGATTLLVWRWRGAPLLVAACWMTVELARQTFPFGGFPWGRLGVSVLDTPWSGLLPYVGVTGSGFAVVTVAAAVVAAAGRPGPRQLVVALLAVVASSGPMVLPVEVDVDGSLTVAVVQGDVPGAGDDIGAYGAEVTANHVAATIELGRRIASGRDDPVDLVVWPENSTTKDPFTDVTTRSGIEQAVGAVGAPVLVGGIVDHPDPTRVLNQGILWSPSGPLPQRYTKHHPVPFGEYIPFRRVLGGLSDRFEEIPRDMVAGRGSTPLDVGGVAVADAICFDVAYQDVIGPQVRAGARLVVVQTSNATFVGTDQVAQQFAITRAQAAQTGRAVAVASTNGLTGLIAPDGSVLARSPLRSTSVLLAELPLSSDMTPAVTWARPLHGLVVAGASGGVVIAAAVRVRARRARRGLRSCPPP